MTGNVEPSGDQLLVEQLRIIEGSARAAGRMPCPVCDHPIDAGDDIATSLGDERLKAIGLTVHANCLTIVGRVGLLDLMHRAYKLSLT